MVAGDHVLRTVASTQMQMALWASASPPRIWPLLLALISEAKVGCHGRTQLPPFPRSMLRRVNVATTQWAPLR